MSEQPIVFSGQSEAWITKLTLGPRDVLVIKTNFKLSQADAQRIKASVEEILPKRADGAPAPILVLGDGADLAVVTPKH